MTFKQTALEVWSGRLYCHFKLARWEHNGFGLFQMANLSTEEYCTTPGIEYITLRDAKTIHSFCKIIFQR